MNCQIIQEIQIPGPVSSKPKPRDVSFECAPQVILMKSHQLSGLDNGPQNDMLPYLEKVMAVYSGLYEWTLHAYAYKPGDEEEAT